MEENFKTNNLINNQNSSAVPNNAQLLTDKVKNIKLSNNKLGGIILLNKPLGITSHSFLKKISYITGIKKIGHGGTLDPAASGLLIVGINEGTKCLSLIEGAIKTYRFTLIFGIQTSTGDSTGEVTGEDMHIPDACNIENILPKFIGKIIQTPPKYSAIKIAGKRAYDLARKNIDFTIPKREVNIYSIKYFATGEFEEKNIFEVVCSKGTYIRSLAEDIAFALNTLGHAHNIERIKIGKFCLSSAFSLEEIEELVYKEKLVDNIWQLEELLDDILVINLTSEDIHAFICGRKIPLSVAQMADLKNFPPGKSYQMEKEKIAVMHAEKLYGFGIIEKIEAQDYLHARRVINVN